MVIEHRGVARDLQIAAVVPHLAHECERAAISVVLDFYRELFQPPTHQTESSYPVGELAEIGLQRRAEVVNQARVEADSRHQKEVPAARTTVVEMEAAERNPFRCVS